ncbi:MAG: glutamyl-tRNA reductase [bacterium]
MITVDWRLIACGISHKATSVEIREPLQLGPGDIAQAHAEYGCQSGILEAVIVCTCNRIEFYTVAKVEVEPFEAVRDFYHSFRQLDLTPLADQFYSLKGKHAVRHLFEVAAGIDSMVLGENQIMAQLREAYSSACSVRTSGKIIHRLFHHAFRIGKQVRTETEMGKGACSVSSAATELLKSQLGPADRPTVLFVGVNKMIALAASAWSKRHYHELLFVNRTKSKADELAARYKTAGHPLSELPQLLPRADIVVTCTSAPDAVIGRSLLSDIIKVHPNHHLTIMDMAIPRDVACQKGEHNNITLFDLEDVKEFARDRQQERQAAVPDARELIEQRLSEFAYWYDHARYELVYNGLEHAFANITEQEMAPILEKLPPEQRREIAAATDKLARRLAQVKLRADGGTQ